MRRPATRNGFAAAAALAAFYLLAGCGGDAPGTPPPPEVTVVKLAAETVTLKRELPGRVSPYLVAEIRPQVSGIVRKRTFEEGGRVAAGEILYRLEDSTYRADAESARAELARTEATLVAARATQKRIAELVDTGAVSRQDRDTAVAGLGEAEAGVGAARAGLARAEVVLGYTRIASPIAGRIGKSSVTQGALVTANQAGALATVQQLDPVYVDLSQSSSEWLALRKEIAAGTLESTKELPVAILLEDGTTYAERGKLVFTDVSVDPATGSSLLRVVVPNASMLLLPGMFVRAIIGTGTRSNAILVPQQGIQRDPSGKAFALVAGEDGKVARREVRVSSTVRDQWLVEDGLAAGDRVIVEGSQKVQPGALVKAVERGTGAAREP
ncbi:MAG TPA: efflux RND transporter periplasmic adaptor subunit [Steroidobacteraceae bacterium]|nr:efflux RND transporter periplasmic adaptor subunit [Steroidobacteraceae bacterium]